jgi:hypothetical protein
LQGICPADVLTPPTIKYKLKEQAVVAKLLFELLNGLTKDQILEVRIELVENLMRLCKRQETPHHYKAPKRRRHSNTRCLDVSTHADNVDKDILRGDILGEVKRHMQSDMY